MKSLFRTLFPAAALAAALAPASANAGGHGGPLDPGGVVLSRPIGLFFEAPLGGYTLYAGQAGSGVASASDYSHINYTTPPAATAQAVLDRLRQLGIPLVAPETQFLDKNPRAADGVRLPIPRPWLKVEDPKEKDKEAEKGKDADKKDNKKDNKKDDKKDDGDN